MLQSMVQAMLASAAGCLLHFWHHADRDALGGGLAFTTDDAHPSAQLLRFSLPCSPPYGPAGWLERPTLQVQGAVSALPCAHLQG